MSRGKRGRKGGGIKALIIAAAVALAAWIGSGQPEDALKSITKSADALDETSVTFLNVGQGDCEIIQLADGRVILIDCGESEQWKTVATYLDKENIETIDYCIATHPHSDHMGGMSYIIERYNIGEFYMPNAVGTTRVYDAMLDALEDKDAAVLEASAGTVMIDEDSVKAEFLAPVSDEYDDLNNYSAVLKLTYGDTSFIFSGDAEEKSEKEMIKKYSASLKSDVLKVGHHGSSTSSCDEYLDAVDPEYAVISCGKDNSYGHPHDETLEALSRRGIKTYRTDEDGTVVMKTDGVKITVE